ncbi:MAG: terminase, partial [Lachnospiraceae bacterium]|nr:terminase [Lachnospiraceae bacterium]
NVTKRKHGGQPGNKNAVGHGAPKRNKNAEKYGFFSKYLPEETVSIIQEMPQDPLDVLWDQIQIAYAAIIRAQQIMYVRDAEDKTVEKIERKDGNVIGEKWEVQQAWDKQANFLKAQSRAQGELRSMIKQYKEIAERVGGKQDAIERLDLILGGLRAHAVEQEAE